MKYKLIGNNDTSNVKATILTNRGVANVQEYLSLNDTCLHEYTLLNNINLGVQMLKNNINNNKPLYIIVDCDVDGYTSASVLYDYITKVLQYSNVTYYIHNGKEHGIDTNILEKLIHTNTGLLLIPDAGTNDTEQCKQLQSLGFEILILDHHEKETENPYATIINNQTSECYPNKHLCGVGIVYKFLQALDEEYWYDNADEYMDMVALGNVSDVMDLREYETKYLVDIGLRNITHPLFKALLKKQSFSVSNEEYPSIIDVSFYITPLINALIRVGTQEEKQLLFQAFIQEYQEFEYTPRKSIKNPEPQLIMEDIYTRVARLCGNAKSKQSKIQDKAVKEIVDIFDDNLMHDSIGFVNATKLENVDKTLTGLIAMKLASKYDKPCLILRRDKKRSNTEHTYFSGSARNIHHGEIEDLKLELSNSKLFVNTVGHPNAFGVTIEKHNIPQAIQYFNNKFKDMSVKVYKVDFCFAENIDYKIIKDIHSLQSLYCSSIEEPLIYISNVNVDLMGFTILKDNKHWKFQNDVVEYVKFNVPTNDEMLNIDDFMYDNIVINVIGKAKINMFGGKSTPQFVIEDYEIVSKN